MTPEQQRIAIAEACGWTWKQGNHTDFLWHDPNDKSHSSFCKERSPLGCITDLPNYLSDLNAMHEAEKLLTAEQYADDYLYHLGCIFNDNDLYIIAKAVHATASQRAEAFLRTLNLWTP
jgi:hypothetical protein